MELDKIPGLKRAVAKAARIEDATRRRAFLSSATRIAGVPVLPLTARHFILLDEARSPLVFGGQKSVGHVGQFLWIVSRDFLMPTHQVPLRQVRAAMRTFTQGIAGLRYGRALKAIGAYLDDALFDAPKRISGYAERPIASLGASLVHEFGRAYSWKPEILDARGQPIHGAGILDMPFAWLLQLRRLIRQEHDPEGDVGNPLSDAAAILAVQRWDARKKARPTQ